MKPEKRRRSLFPKPLNECLEPVTRPTFAKLGPAGSRILADWQKIVGAELAQRCAPVKVSFPTGKTSDGTLTIAVQNGFATELQYAQPVMLEKLAVYFGYQAIGKIKISHTFSPAAPVKKHVRGTVETTISPNILEEVQDTELKTALESFAGTLSAKKNPPR